MESSRSEPSISRHRARGIAEAGQDLGVGHCQQTIVKGLAESDQGTDSQVWQGTVAKEAVSFDWGRGKMTTRRLFFKLRCHIELHIV